MLQQQRYVIGIGLYANIFLGSSPRPKNKHTLMHKLKMEKIKRLLQKQINTYGFELCYKVFNAI